MKLFKYTILSLFAVVALASCSDDDDNDVVVSGPDFTGTYQQVDIMGRSGVNTVFGISGERKNEFNTSTPVEQRAFAAEFTGMINAYHEAYGVAYEDNFLGYSAETLGEVLAFDLLQVAPNEDTAYASLTGRTLSDDVVDVALILTFGGSDGMRFDGENGTPELVSDNVGPNNAAISTSFPYLTAPN